VSGRGDAHVVVPTSRFDDDLAALTDELGFRIDAIFPADSPSTAIVSGHGVRLRLERNGSGAGIRVRLLDDEHDEADVVLPGGSRLEYRPLTTTYALPPNRPSLAIARNSGESAVGRAGMRYRDLIPDRWGGRFISSHIEIPEGGPVPDYVHFHKVRFQSIFVKSGWVRVVYEGQGEPFVLRAGDCVLQPPQIRHRVLESSPALEVIEIGCPAEHETIADHALTLPTAVGDPARRWDGQRFVRHVADGAPYAPWRLGGWEHRESGIAEATGGLAGLRVARPDGVAGPDETWISHDTEFAQLVVLGGSVAFETEAGGPVALGDGDAVSIPGGLRYRLRGPSRGCELLDVTLPASFEARR
jgi:mannose-6-phosphate isomerase-like protein (cupin superfamily)